VWIKKTAILSEKWAIVPKRTWSIADSHSHGHPSKQAAGSQPEQSQNPKGPGLGGFPLFTNIRKQHFSFVFHSHLLQQVNPAGIQ